MVKLNKKFDEEEAKEYFENKIEESVTLIIEKLKDRNIDLSELDNFDAGMLINKEIREKIEDAYDEYIYSSNADWSSVLVLNCIMDKAYEYLNNEEWIKSTVLYSVIDDVLAAYKAFRVKYIEPEPVDSTIIN